MKATKMPMLKVGDKLTQADIDALNDVRRERDAMEKEVTDMSRMVASSRKHNGELQEELAIAAAAAEVWDAENKALHASARVERSPTSYVEGHRDGMERAALLLIEEASSADKLIEEAANKGDSHAKMRLWAIRDAMLAMVSTVRAFKDAGPDDGESNERSPQNPKPSDEVSQPSRAAGEGRATRDVASEGAGPCGLVRRWRHIKRGSVYKEIGRGILQTELALPDNAPVMMYQGDDGKLWARPTHEFHDGRFEVVLVDDPASAPVVQQPGETPRTDKHLGYVPERYQAIPEFQGIVNLARDLERSMNYYRDRERENTRELSRQLRVAVETPKMEIPEDRDAILEEAVYAIGELDGGDPERDKALEDAMRTVSALKAGVVSEGREHG